MKTLIYGAGPIGRWLALRLQQANHDVTLLARNQTFRSLEENGIEIVDGLLDDVPRQPEAEEMEVAS